MNKIITVLAIGGFLLLFSFSSEDKKEDVDRNIKSHSDLIKLARKTCEQKYLETGILCGTALSQFIKESKSRYGKDKISGLVNTTKNISNIKCKKHYNKKHKLELEKFAKDNPNKRLCCTGAHDDDKYDRFVNYNSYQEGIDAYYTFLQENKRYKKAFEIIPKRLKDGMPLEKLMYSSGQQLLAIGKAGFATSDGYANSCIDIREDKNYKELDKQVLARAHFNSNNRNTNKEIWPEIVAIEKELEKLKKRAK